MMFGGWSSVAAVRTVVISIMEFSAGSRSMLAVVLGERPAAATDFCQIYFADPVTAAVLGSWVA